MEGKSENEQNPGRDGEVWRARLAAELRAHQAEQQRLWGGIDEMTRARYEAGKCTTEETAQVEQAMRDHPALRECMETARGIFAEWSATAPATRSQQNRRGEKPRSDHAERPETDSGKLR
jgi:hypothetical protein